MDLRALVPGLFVLCVCGGAVSRPPSVTIVSVLQKPAPPLTAPSAAEDARVKELLDEALRAMDRGDRTSASAAALKVVCREPPVTSEELAACPPPRSADVSSGWALVGELAFEGSLELTGPTVAVDPARPDQLPVAEMAYARALHVTPSRMPRAAVLYKLGWARYRLDRFDAAIETFLEVLDAVRTSPASARDSIDLRDEALEYAAISIAETDWDGDGQDDPVRGFARPEVQARLRDDRPELPDLYARVVSVLVDQAECADAAAALAATGARFPRYAKLAELKQSVAQSCP